jgi:hypothetical protein
MNPEPNASDVAILTAQTGPAIREMLRHWSAEEVEARVREALRQLQLVAVNSGEK